MDCKQFKTYIWYLSCNGYKWFLKLINNSWSDRPINDVYFGQVDESWYPIKHQMKIPATREKNLWYPGYSGCNITYFAETEHEEINNWKSNDYRREKSRVILPLFIL